MNDNLTSVTLDLAADAIQMAGWQVGVAGMDPDGPYCLMGGIGAATDSVVSTGRFSYWAVEETPAAVAVRDYLGIKGGRLWMWNDVPCRSQEQVIEVLRAAAAVERVKEAAYETADQPLPVEFPEPTAA